MFVHRDQLMLSAHEINERLERPVGRATIRRDLVDLLSKNLLSTQGRGRYSQKKKVKQHVHSQSYYEKTDPLVLSNLFLSFI